VRQAIAPPIPAMINNSRTAAMMIRPRRSCRGGSAARRAPLPGGAVRGSSVVALDQDRPSQNR
jgi:hypothetical protein